MVELTNSAFFHVPKTGGTWVHEVLKNACKIVDTRVGHDAPDKHAIKGKKSFVFIRHPLGYYESNYHYERKHFNRSRRHDSGFEITNFTFLDFDSYVKYTVEQYPGILTKMYAPYVDYADFIGKQENLREDLKKALRMFDEEFIEAYIDKTPPINKGEYVSYISPKSTELILESEKEIIKRFYA